MREELTVGDLPDYTRFRLKGRGEGGSPIYLKGSWRQGKQGIEIAKKPAGATLNAKNTDSGSYLLLADWLPVVRAR